MKACLTLIILFSVSILHSNAQLKYPIARTEPFDTVIYQKKLSDEYAWLSRPEHEKEMLEFCKSQGKFTESILDSITGTALISGVIKKIYDSYNPNEIVVRGVQGTQIYYYKPNQGKRPLLKRDGYNGKEEQVMELPVTLSDKRYQVKKYCFAYNKPLLALMLVQSGESNPHIRFFDLAKKEFLKDSIGPVMFNDASGVSMAWLPNDAGLIYSQAPVENSKEEDYYRGKLKLHLLDGKDNREDVLLFGQGVIDGIDLQDYEVPYVYSFALSPYIIARVRAGKGDNYAFAIHYTELNGAKTKWKKLEGYKCNDGTFTAKDGFIYAVSGDVSKREIIKVNLKTGEPPALFLPEQENVVESIASGKDVLYVKYTSPGKLGILKMGYTNPRPVEIPMPFDGTVNKLKIVGENDLLFEISNWTRNNEYYIVSHLANQVSLLPGAGNPNSFTESFTSKVIYIPSRDGVKIPVSLVYTKGTIPGEKPLPLLIDSYGCFGDSRNPEFWPENFIWLSQGGIFAVAHIRGGGELGADWYKSGCYPTKMNSINDIVDVAGYFVENNYTTPAQQALIGGSCGSLNVGLATLQRPDLFSVGSFEVGIPDLVTNKGPSFGKGQNEFGPLDTEEGFKSRLSISAYYHIIKNKKAPAMLMINGATDYIVPLHNVARYVAKLQNFQDSERPILFMVDWAGGHNTAGYTPKDVVRKFKFLFWQTGNVNFQLKQGQ